MIFVAILFSILAFAPSASATYNRGLGVIDLPDEEFVAGQIMQATSTSDAALVGGAAGTMLIGVDEGGKLTYGRVVFDEGMTLSGCPSDRPFLSFTPHDGTEAKFVCQSLDLDLGSDILPFVFYESSLVTQGLMTLNAGTSEPGNLILTTGKTTDNADLTVVGVNRVLELQQANRTFGAVDDLTVIRANLISWDSSITVIGTNTFPQLFGIRGEIHQETDDYLGMTVMQFQPKIYMGLNSGTYTGYSNFYSNPVLYAEREGITLLDLSGDFFSNVIFDKYNNEGETNEWGAASAFTAFRASGTARTAFGEFNGFECGDLIGSGNVTDRSCFVVKAQTAAPDGGTRYGFVTLGNIDIGMLINSGATTGIQNASTTVNPPGAALTLGSAGSPTSITATTTVVELGVTGSAPDNIRVLPNPNIVDGADGQVVTIVVSTDSGIVFTDGFNIDLSDNQCAPMCSESVGVEKCTLAEGDTISFIFLDSTGVWHMTGCADNDPVAAGGTNLTKTHALIVKCGGTDDTAAISTSITAAAAGTHNTGDVLLTGASCKFSNVELLSDVSVSCATGTTLRPLNVSNAMLKRPSGYIQDWSVSDCKVSMDGLHTEFLDVSWNGAAGPSTSTLGNAGWVVDNVEVRFADAVISEDDEDVFSYFNLSCDLLQSTFVNSGTSCRFSNNRILGSIDADYTGSTANVNAGDSGVSFTSARLRGDPTTLFGAVSLLIDGNNISSVEASAVRIGIDASDEEPGGSVVAVVSNNVFWTAKSESEIFDNHIEGDPNDDTTLAYSQITGNMFGNHELLGSAPGRSRYVELAGGNNQVVGNTFFPGVVPVLGNSVNFVGNYTATSTNGPITACGDPFYTTQSCAHVSFVGNVATGRFKVTNPDDFVFSSNKMLGSDVGVDIEKWFASDSVPGENKLRSISIMGNTLALGPPDASSTKSVIDFIVHASDTSGDPANIQDVQITGNVLGKSNATSGEEAFLPKYCVNGGDDVEFTYDGFQVLDNILACTHPGWDGATTGTTGQTFGDGTIVNYAFCNNADKTTTKLSAECSSDKLQRIVGRFTLPEGTVASSGDSAERDEINSTYPCWNSTTKDCSYPLTVFPAFDLLGTQLASIGTNPVAYDYTVSPAFTVTQNLSMVRGAGKLKNMRCRSDVEHVSTSILSTTSGGCVFLSGTWVNTADGLPSGGACISSGATNCTTGDAATWGRKVTVYKSSIPTSGDYDGLLWPLMTEVSDMSCQTVGCLVGNGDGALSCSDSGSVDVVATDRLQFRVEQVGTGSPVTNASTITCVFDWDPE